MYEPEQRTTPEPLSEAWSEPPTNSWTKLSETYLRNVDAPSTSSLSLQKQEERANGAPSRSILSFMTFITEIRPVKRSVLIDPSLVESYLY